MKILIIKLSSIGDVVHTLPALYSLKKGYPMAEIDWLVEEAAKDIIEKHQLLNKVIVVHRRGLLKSSKASLQTLKDLKKNSYDIVIDFQGLLKSSIWTYLSRGKRRIGFDRGREFSHIFLNEKVPPYDPDKHAVLRYLDLAKHAGGITNKVMFPIQFHRKEKDRALTLLKSSGIVKGDSFAVICPVARWKTKLWGTKQFYALTRSITKSLGLKLVLLGSASDRAILDRVASSSDNVLNLAGKTTLKEMAYIMKLASFAVSVDSGPMHIAAAVGLPVIALFGPTAPWRTGPYGKKNIILRKDMGCSPCFSKTCVDNICMKEITVEEVMEAVTALTSEMHIENVTHFNEALLGAKRRISQ